MSEHGRRWTALYRYDRGEGVWLAHVAEIPEVQTYGPTLQGAEAYLRDALALWLEVDEAKVTVRPASD